MSRSPSLVLRHTSWKGDLTQNLTDHAILSIACQGVHVGLLVYSNFHGPLGTRARGEVRWDSLGIFCQCEILDFNAHGLQGKVRVRLPSM